MGIRAFVATLSVTNLFIKLVVNLIEFIELFWEFYLLLPPHEKKPTIEK
jgi:hypothetical protein